MPSCQACRRASGRGSGRCRTRLFVRRTRCGWARSPAGQGTRAQPAASGRGANGGACRRGVPIHPMRKSLQAACVSGLTRPSAGGANGGCAPRRQAHDSPQTHGAPRQRSLVSTISLPERTHASSLGVCPVRAPDRTLTEQSCVPSGGDATATDSPAQPADRARSLECTATLMDATVEFMPSSEASKAKPLTLMRLFLHPDRTDA